MNNIVPIETMYKGVKFRSRLEARWAVFFDACGIEWVYEPEGFEVGNSLRYLPDFLLFNVHGRNGNDRTETDDSTNNIYVEVKGKGDEKSYKKISAFVFEDGTLLEDELPFGMERVKNPLLILGYPPNKDDLWGIIDWVCNYNENVERCFLDYFSFHTIDGDNYPAIPCISKKRRFELVGPDYIEKIDVERTLKAYQIAKSARFEYGETPNINKVTKVTPEDIIEVLKRWNEVVNKVPMSMRLYVKDGVPTVGEDGNLTLVYSDDFPYGAMCTERYQAELRNAIIAIVDKDVTVKMKYIDKSDTQSNNIMDITKFINDETTFID